MRPLRVAMLVPDNRDEKGQYDRLEPEFGPAPTNLLAGFADIPDLEVHVVSCSRRPIAAPVRLAGNTRFHLLVTGPKGRLRSLYAGSVLAVRRLLHQLCPDIVHGQGTERYAALAAAFSGFPSLVTVHGNMGAIAGLSRALPFSYLWMSARLEALAVARAGGVLCLTSYTERLVRGHAKRTWILPNAVGPEFFDIESRPTSRPTLVCVANIVSYKNQVRLIRALAPLAEQRPLRLKFAGVSVPGDPYAEEFKREVGAHPWCEYDGFWDSGRLREELSAATLLVHPSLEDNCPMAVMEAMAAGVPVAAARAGGLPDLIEHGHSGVMFDPLNDDDVRCQVARLLDDAGCRDRLASNARKKAHERFSTTVVATAQRRIYDELLAHG